MPTTKAYAWIRCMKDVSLHVWMECVDPNNSNPAQQGENILIRLGDYGTIQKMCTGTGSLYTFYSETRIGGEKPSIIPLGVGLTPFETVLKRLKEAGYITYTLM